MERSEPMFFILSFLFLWNPLVLAGGQLSPPRGVGGGDDDRRRLQTYIVHVQKPRNLVLSSREQREEWHKSFLPTTLTHSGESRLVYSYEHVIGGFAARLTAEEVEAMEAMDGFLLAQPDAELVPRTTHTPKFLRLTRSGQLWDMGNRGSGRVIGVLENLFATPTHKSFGDKGMPPPPARWMGACDIEVDSCNNKLIANRVFNASGLPYYGADDGSHGIHVASTAAGNYVTGADFNGVACGVAVGIAPRAHLAFYSLRGISDWLMAVDQAINDGIDVLSISIGPTNAPPFYANSVDIATLAAVRRGVFVSVAIGNDGPKRETLLDNTPWTLSVGASTSDRVIRMELRLGNGRVIPAEYAASEYVFKPPTGTPFPAVLPGYWKGNNTVTHCRDKNFGDEDVTGKAVLCLRDDEKHAQFSPFATSCLVKDAGGTVAVLLNKRLPGSTVLYDYSCGPMVFVSYEDSKELIDYVTSALEPTISLEPVGTITGVHRSPAVAYFSARGPSKVNNGVLKPDILGPGVNILAAHTWGDSDFKFESGTSMATPHLSGIAAILKNVHPTWSPAMIKSAIMTTSDWMDNAGMPIADETGNPANLFATGAGHVNATRAADPGLVYDLQFDDYVKYVCGLGYNEKQRNAVLGGIFDCVDYGAISGEELNYPSFSVRLSSIRKTVSRTVTNVGPARSIYTVSIDQPPNVWIDVFPRRLDFSNVGQMRKYKVIIAWIGPRRLPSDFLEGQLTWISAQHMVRSPISISF